MHIISPSPAMSSQDSDDFVWPAPPYCDFPQPPHGHASRQCQLRLSDGRTLQGSLRGFNPDEARLELDFPAGTAGPSPAYPSIVQLRMPRPVRMLAQVLPPAVSAEQSHPASELQTFKIELHDSEPFSGETRGFVSARSGMFLYLPAGQDRVVRCFVPAGRIVAFHIGDPIGQLLIEQNMASTDAVSAALDRQRELRSQKLGDLLTQNQIVTADELAVALRHQQQRPILRQGEALVELGLLTAGELENGLREQDKNRKVPLGQILIDMGVVDKDTIKAVLAKKLGIPFVNLRRFNILPEVIRMVPESLVYRHHVIPVSQTDTALVVAIENPLATAVLEELRFMTGKKILPVMAEEEDLRSAIKRHYANPFADAAIEAEISAQDWSAGPHKAEAGEGRIDALATQLATEGLEVELVDEQDATADNTLVKLVNKMIMDAYEQKASDIHIETYPGKKNTRIRFRKDAVMIKYLKLPSKFHTVLVSRIKIMSTLDISERRKPQDGKIDFSRHGPARLELRVVTIPTNNGLEDVVMRLLAAAKPLPIGELGFSENVLRDVRAMVVKPHGLCLVCGPTGSGKTTTLHSLLGYINTDERKIWTAEDPVEITQEGLRQVQVNARIGWTFAAAMRTFLRADPDVIMVGEMRDAETTKTGIEASLTGHLVLSTLHTNSAPESVVRLLDMGMDPFNFADALLGILAQRLARGLCATCKKPYRPDAQELDELSNEYCLEGALDKTRVLHEWRAQYGNAKGDLSLYRAPGCDDCGQSGYRGRVGLHEFLLADATVKRLIQTRATVTDIKAAAMAAGMRTLKQNGIEKILQGLTDMPQVRAVCG